MARQYLSNTFTSLYTALTATYASGHSTSQDVSTAGKQLVALLKDLDTLLYTSPPYLLSTWISDAKQWAHGNASYAAYLEYNARNQLTLWGPDGEINDYASKQWAGVVGEYYSERWGTFVEILVKSKAEGTLYNATLVSQTMLDIGKKWDQQKWGSRAGETWGTKGDTFDVVSRILQRWA